MNGRALKDVSRLVLVAVVGSLLGTAALAQITLRASVDSSGAGVNDVSHGPHLSTDGRYVAFSSLASDLVPGDTNDDQDVFVRDRLTGLVERVSVDSAGNQAGASYTYVGPLSYCSAISGDGRWVLFPSNADNLVSGDTNDDSDVFVHDRQSGTTTRVSVDSSGAQGDGSSENGGISYDGRFVAFSSSATNLVPGDVNARGDVFVHDRASGATTLVSRHSSGTLGNHHSFHPALSGDGRFVAFRSYATNLVAGDTNGRDDIFVHDRLTGVTFRASVDSVGAQANGHSYQPKISFDGRFTTFASRASNLVAGDTNGFEDVFVHDRVAGLTTRVSLTATGGQGDGDSELPAISSDGSLVAFASVATNLVAGDTNGYSDVFVHERASAATARVSVDSAGSERAGYSGLYTWVGPYWNVLGLALSGGGRHVAFGSTAAFVSGDTNGVTDVYLHDRHAVLDYCAAQVNSLGCTTRIGWEGVPSAGATGGFALTALDVRNRQPGLVLYSVDARRTQPFRGGTLCIGPPVHRTSALDSGGSPPSTADCTGTYWLDMNAFAAGLGGGQPHPELRQPGTWVYAQWWSRDPGAPGNTNLTDALRYEVGL